MVTRDVVRLEQRPALLVVAVVVAVVVVCLVLLLVGCMCDMAGVAACSE